MPTAEEFLRYVPKRLQFEWSIDDQGIVTIIVPKFTGKIGKTFCKALRRENIFAANLDKLGSMIWKQCDGTNSVQDILMFIIKEAPNEKDIEQRLFLFLQQLKALNYISY